MRTKLKSSKTKWTKSKKPNIETFKTYWNALNLLYDAPNDQAQ